jgi:UDP-N-acetylmuramoylalanine--D-glutamate ligase
MNNLSQSTLLMLRDKNILVLGFGLTGQSCARFLTANNISFAVNDSREKVINNLAEFMQAHNKAKITLGSWDKSLIASAEIILVSPGIDLATPAIKSAINSGCLIWGDVELYCRLTDTPILAVTGSNGKSTVVSLLSYLGKVIGHNIESGGNIGVPVLDHLVTGSDDDSVPEFLVLELSSFQLESLNSMQAIAATILNVSDDHLDRHLTLNNYQNIKQSIYQQCNIALINRDDKATYVDGAAEEKIKKVLSFGSDSPEEGHFGLSIINKKITLMFGDNPLISINQLPLAGIHNALNYLATLALGYSAGWSLTAMVQNLAGFTGLAHRCQRINHDDGINWINDSKATNVGATLAAINGFSKILQPSERLILIAGGEGKGANFLPLKKSITEHVSQLITLGKDGDKIASFSDSTIEVESLEEAVITANRLAKVDDTVLLSPACASLDMFKNFAERGEVFTNAVKRLKVEN